ncbi:extracellular solute-binding protein [Auraticoccus monumenti]|uniref:Carbohydrate ABC transporter substrate-binding protein, CUT1 family n=1 Tax=Auraticoccus monumenti TaxID=675864 RepID=A0A1G6W7P9_9ACTN|nr:extracellular solute-binding protein [Auraticoccus monumenti]SDD61828.1 carbohydrate ABC transporter substrate-binding protein, CUT1 family [Auraticoccus monumenti]
MTTPARRSLAPVLGRRTFLAGSLTAVGLTATGCGGGGAGGDAEDLGVVKIMAPVLNSQTPDPEGRLQKAVEELVGKKLDITWVPNSSYGDRMNVTLASDDLPEVMVVQGKVPSFVQSAEAGAFWDLTDKLGQYPNLTAANPEIAQAASVNGTSYGVFRSRDEMRVTTIVRADWLDKLGLDAPETVDDLYEVAKAFKEERPGGKESTGLIIPKWPGGYASNSPYDVMETWFGAPNAWGERDGRLVPGFDTEEHLEADRFIRKMREEGLINADFATLDSANWNDPFFNGDGGMIIDVDSRIFVLAKLFEEQDPGNGYSYLAQTGNLVGPDGERHSLPSSGFSGFLAISKQSVPTEEELADVLAMLDTMATKEGQVLMNNGIEGENFTVEDGYSLPAEGPDAEVLTNDATAFAQLGTNNAGYQAYQAAPENEAAKEAYDRRDMLRARDLETAVYNAAAALVSPTASSQGAVLDQIVADARIQYVAGQIDEAGYRAEIQRWHTSGGDQVITEINDLAAQLR